MKIAVFHNFMDNIGGAEIVCLTLARELNADLYTTNINPENIEKMGFADVLPRIKSIGKVPKDSPQRQQLTSLKFRKLNLRGKYDFFIIGGDWAISGAMKNKPNIYYCHTPLRELYDLKKFVRKEMMPFWKRPIFDFWTAFNIYLNRKYVRNAGRIYCNSENTRKRIKEYLKQDAEVIYPPIDTKRFQSRKSKDFWLSVNRLLKAKRVDLQLKAFKKLPNQKLVIVGSYEKGSQHFKEYISYLNKIKPKNVEILNWADDKKLKKLYSECKGFITTAKDEDFGMTAVEAMAAGKPVIAPDEGGYKESVINGKTGILIDNIDEDKIADSLKRISRELEKNPGKYRNECIKQAKKFDVSVFIGKIKDGIKI
jgi:glycosyltransferase involved in cell wall biosynthesis